MSGLIAEFRSKEEMLRALRGLRDLGLSRIETYTPFPVTEAQEHLPRPLVAWWTFGSGLLGGLGAFALMQWINVADYPIDVGGRPMSSIPTWIPITFETTILFAACAAFAGWMFAAGLPRPHHPVFEVEGFVRASDDRFFVAVDEDDERFDEEAVRGCLGAAVAVRPVGEVS